MPKLIDLTGQRFNRLLVLERAENKNDRAAWKCKCDCGNIKIVKSGDLRSGRTQSCGCLNKEKSLQRNHERNTVHKGDVFGDLVVIEELGYEFNGAESHKRKMVLCQCKCGKIIKINTHTLKTGKINCGCDTMSYGEQKIDKLLRKYNIKYETQKTFDSCRSNKNYLLKFDFYIDNKYLIEYNGAQHYEQIDFLNSKETQERDKIKIQWCKDNNIPIIIIPYTHYNDICIEDLQLETSQFLLK